MAKFDVSNNLDPVFVALAYIRKILKVFLTNFVNFEKKLSCFPVLTFKSLFRSNPDLLEFKEVEIIFFFKVGKRTG